MDILQPDGWPRPSGYANGVSAQGKQIFVAGQIGWDRDCRLVSADLVEQFRQVLDNTMAVLRAGGAGPEHVVRMTWYVTDLGEYRSSLRGLGEVYREYFGHHYPAMAVVEVKGLVEHGAKVEIETTAVISD